MLCRQITTGHGDAVVDGSKVRRRAKSIRHAQSAPKCSIHSSNPQKASYWVFTPQSVLNTPGGQGVLHYADRVIFYKQEEGRGRSSRCAAAPSRTNSTGSGLNGILRICCCVYTATFCSLLLKIDLDINFRDCTFPPAEDRLLRIGTEGSKTKPRRALNRRLSTRHTSYPGQGTAKEQYERIFTPSIFLVST